MYGLVVPWIRWHGKKRRDYMSWPENALRLCAAEWKACGRAPFLLDSWKGVGLRICHVISIHRDAGGDRIVFFVAHK